MAFFLLLAKKKILEFLVFWFKIKEPYISQILLKLWLIGNRTSCRPIRSVIILVMKQIWLPSYGTNSRGVQLYHVRPWPNVELFVRRTKLIELSSWKLSSTSGSVKFVWISFDRRTRSIRLKVISEANVDLYMRRTKLIYKKFVWWCIFSPARSGENRHVLEFDFRPNGRT